MVRKTDFPDVLMCKTIDDHETTCRKRPQQVSQSIGGYFWLSFNVYLTKKNHYNFHGQFVSREKSTRLSGIMVIGEESNC